VDCGGGSTADGTSWIPEYCLAINLRAHALENLKNVLQPVSQAAGRGSPEVGSSGLKKAQVAG
jgi:hypothetical protein